MRIHSDNQNKTGAQKSNDHDLQVGLAISAIDRMIHSRLRFLAAADSGPAPIVESSKAQFPASACDLRHKAALLAKSLDRFNF
jgi:hypothetical protein